MQRAMRGIPETFAVSYVAAKEWRTFCKKKEQNKVAAMSVDERSDDIRERFQLISFSWTESSPGAKRSWRDYVRGYCRDYDRLGYAPRILMFTMFLTEFEYDFPSSCAAKQWRRPFAFTDGRGETGRSLVRLWGRVVRLT